MDAVLATFNPPLHATRDKKGCTACPKPYKCTGTQCLGPNLYFRRNWASLEVVLMSDEGDQSSTSQAAFLSFLASLVDPLKGSFARVHGILAQGSCGKQAAKWTATATATGGKVQDLCAGSYTKFIQSLASRVFGLQDQFNLTRTPVPSSVKIIVDGNAATGATYDAKSNSVIFTTPPPDKSKVEVNYSVKCGP